MNNISPLSPNERESMIRYIEGTYPADDNDLGKRFLEEARTESQVWQDESDAVILAYYDKCVREEAALAVKLERENRAIMRRCRRFRMH